MTDLRFTAEQDTPCPVRLGRNGYVQTGEFRVPEKGELFILPAKADTYPLEHEPQVVGTAGVEEPRHIVKPIHPEDRELLEEAGPFGMLMVIFGGLRFADEDAA